MTFILSSVDMWIYFQLFGRTYRKIEHGVFILILDLCLYRACVKDLMYYLKPMKLEGGNKLS